MLSLLPVRLCGEKPVSNLHNEGCFSAPLHATGMSTCGSEL